MQHLGTHLDLELDLIVNHISPSSPEFQDFLAHGDTSPFAEMFMDWDKFWGPGETCLAPKMPTSCPRL